MLDFPWGKRPATVPEIGDHVRATLYGGIGYRPARILDVSPGGSRIKIGLLDTTIRESDRALSKGDGSLWVSYDAEGLADRAVRGGSIVLPWDGTQYYRVGLASIAFEEPSYLS